MKFEEVLDDELRYVADRRAGLKSERSGASAPATGPSPEPPSPETALTRASQAELVGLALSGGGIRSATFNLGLLQGLARQGVLGKFDYLSTVSGGGYIGCWFSVWVQRAGLSTVLERLTQSCATASSTVFPIDHLRKYSNYLTPRIGLLSLDSWTLIATYLRNLFLNLLVLVPGVILLLLLPRFLIAVYLWTAQTNIVVPGVPILAIDVVLVGLLAVALLLIATSLSYVQSNIAISAANSGRALHWLLGSLFAASVVACLSYSKEPIAHEAVATQKRLADLPGLEGAARTQLEQLSNVDSNELMQSEPRIAARIGELATDLSPAVGIGRITPEPAPVWNGSKRRQDSVEELVTGLLQPKQAAEKLKPSAAGAEPSVTAIERGVKIARSAKDAEVRQLDAQQQRLTKKVADIRAIAPQASTMLQELEKLDDARPWWTQLEPTDDEWNAILPSDDSTSRFLPLTFAGRYAAVFALLHLLADAFGLLWFWNILRHSETADWSFYHGRTITGIFLAGIVSGAIGGLLMAVVYAYWLVDLADAPQAMLTWGPPAIVMVFVIATSIRVGLTSRIFDEGVREWWARLCAWLLVYVAAWTGLLAIALYSPLYVELSSAQANWAAMGAWLATTIAGLLAAKSPQTGSPQDNSRPLDWLVKAAPPIFLLGLLTVLAWTVHQLTDLHRPRSQNAALVGFPETLQPSAISTVVTNTEQLPSSSGTLTRQTRAEAVQHVTPPENVKASYWDDIYDTPLSHAIVLGVACLGLLVIFVPYVDVNKFSIHSLYANRLVRCYLGATNSMRTPHPFTGFDTFDDLPLEKLTEPAVGVPGPLHLINTCLNLVHGDNLAWQERKGTSFTLSPLACGSDATGYRRPPEFAGETLSVGKAIAISGAAASPNAGYHSSPAIGALMTVFNVRLGWWIGNPRGVAWKSSGPRQGLTWLLTELFSLTNARSRYLYLSDGGHFENLGVHELVRRRCRFILASDSGADPDRSFFDLASLIRKCRIDLGVDIVIDGDHELALGSTNGRSKAYYCLAKIRYPDGPPGRLVYVKPGVCQGEPADVLNYIKDNQQYPHEPTADQFFSESQFESYRILGLHIAQHLAATPANPDDTAADVFGRFKPPQLTETVKLACPLTQQ